MKKEFITIQEAATYLGKSAQTIRRMIKRGDLSAKRIRNPQGFHYVLPREEVIIDELSTKVDLQKLKSEFSKSTDANKMLDNTTVQNPVKTQTNTKVDPPTSQASSPTNQEAIKVTRKRDKVALDRNVLDEVLKRHHKECIYLFELIEKLQSELDLEKRRPKSFFAYFFDWLTH